MARFSKGDSNVSERYAAGIMEQTRLIRACLLKRVTDPSTFKLRDIKDFTEFVSAFMDMGEEELS